MIILIWKSPTYSKYFVEVDGLQDQDLGYSASQNYLAHKAKAKYPASKVLTTRNKAHPCNATTEELRT